MNSSFSCVNAQQEQTCEESGKFELRNCVNKKFESNAISFLNYQFERLLNGILRNGALVKTDVRLTACFLSS